MTFKSGMGLFCLCLLVSKDCLWMENILFLETLEENAFGRCLHLEGIKG